jgi:TatD DNase family protein
MLVDSHCHLNFPDFAPDLDDVVTRARAAGVKVMQTICTELAEFEEVYALTQRFEGVYCSVGVHPNDSGKQEVVPASELIERAAREKVIGIGETGLDYYYTHSDRESQRASFLEHIVASRATQLPIIIHTRDADADTISMLKEETSKGSFPGVIHCFTSSKELADKTVEMGFYISLSGILTFKSAGAIRDALADVPLDRLLVETDAPYLAPMPHRGKRNEPSYVVHTNRVLAELKGISEQECARITTENFFRLFSKAKMPVGG